MTFPMLYSADDIAKLVDEAGFLPFFKNAIEGFSIEELTPPELWFSASVDGPWEWKGPVIKRGIAYGKFYGGKAMFISREWYPRFANLRRDGYDFDSRVDEGLVRYSDERVYAALEREGPVLSKRLKAYAGFGGKDGAKGFDGVMTRLQMQCYALIADFVYPVDKSGKVYGWGVAQYATPEQFFGADIRREMYREKPSVARDEILAHLSLILPDADKKLIEKIVEM